MEMTGSLKEAMHSLNVNHSHDVAIAQTIEDGLEEQMYLFADRLEIGCSLACITGDKIANPGMLQKVIVQLLLNHKSFELNFLRSL